MVHGHALIDGGCGGELLLRDVQGTPIGKEGAAFAAFEASVAAGIVVLGAEAIGIIELSRDATVEFLRTRAQFGVQIGGFQAFQHRMATVVLEIE
jgi:alkylation response protein AidB-like acyl-CoA dehydrogenase